MFNRRAADRTTIPDLNHCLGLRPLASGHLYEAELVLGFIDETHPAHLHFLGFPSWSGYLARCHQSQFIGNWRGTGSRLP